MLPEHVILQVLVHDCDHEILGYFFGRECSVQLTILLPHLEGTLQLFTLREDVAHDVKEHPCTSVGIEDRTRVVVSSGLVPFTVKHVRSP